MLLLALDTSSASVSVALSDGARILSQGGATDGRRHAELLAPTVQQVLRDAGATPGDLDRIAVGVGPGPFTGLRVGLVTATTLGHVLGIEVHGICSLDVVAAEALQDDPAMPNDQAAADGVTLPELVVATDARRREVYWARYRLGPRGEAVRVGPPRVSAPGDVARQGLPVVGQGSALYPDLLGPPRGPGSPSAAVLAVLAAERISTGGELQAPQPLYLRRPDAQEPSTRKQVLPR